MLKKINEVIFPLNSMENEQRNANCVGGREP